MSHPPVRKREIFGWAMFDFANSSYTTIIVTVAFSVYFTTVVSPGATGDTLWGFALLASNLIVVASSPLIGAVADDSGNKKGLLAVTWLVCVVGTGALWFVLPGDVALALTFFVLSNVAYSFGENLAGAFLPEISTPANIGWISGFAWGLGYLGGLGCLLLVRPLLAAGFTVENLNGLRLTWVITALFFLLAAVPTFVFLRERAPRGESRSLAGYWRVGFQRLAATARSVRHFSELARFLIIFTVYSAGLMTVIAFTGIYAVRTIGFEASELVTMFIVVQLSATGGALLFGRIQDRIGSRRSIQIALVLWILVCVAAAAATTKGQFWVITLFAGLGIGSLQASSRALVGLLSPVAKSGEFFAFWGLANRLAYAGGPAVFGVVSALAGSQRIAILTTSLFFLAGLVAMSTVSVERGRAAAIAWDERETGA
ncbi:MAG TPA: MFS transporter [Thermoanaerobaculia bacterium]